MIEYTKQLIYAAIGIVLSAGIPLLLLVTVVNILEKIKTNDNTEDS